MCTVGACECTGDIHMSEYACALDIFTFEPECGTDGWRNVESSYSVVARSELQQMELAANRAFTAGSS